MISDKRPLLPKDATEKEINAAITALDRVLGYKPDLEYRLTMDLDYYRIRLQGIGTTDGNHA